LNVGMSDRVATLAWNGYRHLELYFAAAGKGAVMHAIDPRQSAAEIAWIADHAEDACLFFDLTFLPIVEAIAPTLQSVRTFVALTDRAHMPAQTRIAGLLCYEELLAAESDDYAWPEFDEKLASSLCYARATAGHPKGVLYSHRSTMLHAFAVALP